MIRISGPFAVLSVAVALAAPGCLAEEGDLGDDELGEAELEAYVLRWGPTQGRETLNGLDPTTLWNNYSYMMATLETAVGRSQAARNLLNRQGGGELMEYLVKGAGERGDTIESHGIPFPGGLGLGRAWETTPLVYEEARWVGASVLLHTNGFAKPVPLMATMDRYPVNSYTFEEGGFYMVGDPSEPDGPNAAALCACGGSGVVDMCADAPQYLHLRTMADPATTEFVYAGACDKVCNEDKYGTYCWCPTPDNGWQVSRQVLFSYLEEDAFPGCPDAD